jgi:hypothetical protein
MYAIEYRWISAEIPVMKSDIVMDSGSTRSAAGTWSVPTLSHPNKCTVTSRDEWCSKRKKQITETTKLTVTAPVPVAPICRSVMLRPLRSTRRNPSNGNSTISVATWPISALQF